MSNGLDYAAGLIDGEGFVGAILSNKRQTVSPVLSVNMCEKAGLDLLVSLFGGSIRLAKSKMLKWRDQYEWRLYHANAIQAIEALEPYLRVKKKQAQILLSIKWDRPIGLRHTLEERLRRLEVFQAVKILNKRGK